MKATGRNHKPSLSSGLHPTQASTCATLPATAPRLLSTAELESHLGESQRTLASEKAKTLELKGAVETKKQNVQDLEHRHQANQQLIVTYEREISRQRPGRPNSTTGQNPGTLAATALALQAQIEAAVSTHAEQMDAMGVSVLPEGHHNKVVELTLAQLALYRSQLEQRQESGSTRLHSLLERAQAGHEELAAIRTELKEAKRGRLEDVKEHQKLAREESYSLAVLTEKKSKAADQLAREAAQSVYQTLEAKLPESDFLEALKGKLLARGVQI